MDKELEDLLRKASTAKLTDAEVEENRFALAAANGHLSDERITLETMRATRTTMVAAETKKK